MKQSVRFMMVFLMSLFFAVPVMAGFEITAENFPDPEFRKVVAGFDTDNDGWLIYDEFIEVKKIDCEKNELIQDITGIGIFENLEELSVWKCPLKKLDVSANTKLTYLDCCETGISSLDVSSNPDLIQLYAYGNAFTTLDLSHCPNLSKAVKNGIYNNDKENGTACSFADDPTGSFLVVDKKITIKLADETIDVAKLSGYVPGGSNSPGETSPAETPAEDETKPGNSSGNGSSGSNSGTDSGEGSGTSSGEDDDVLLRSLHFLPLRHGDYILLGNAVEVQYSVSRGAANGQTYCTISVQYPNGETSNLYSSDKVRVGSKPSASFTPTEEGTYKITGVVGSYVDMMYGGSGILLSRIRNPFLTESIDIHVVTTLPTAADPAADNPANPSDTPANPSDPGDKNSNTNDTNKGMDDKGGEQKNTDKDSGQNSGNTKDSADPANPADPAKPSDSRGQEGTTNCAQHTFGDWKVTKKATYTAKGEMTRTCSKCGYAEKASVEKLKVKAGAVLTDKTGSYKILKGLKTAAFVSPAKKTVKTVKIPATVKLAGKTYKVTKIQGKAFSGCSKLEKVTIGKNVAEIGAKAFSGCKKLNTVTIGAGVKTIGKQAFYNCSALKKITIQSKKLTAKKTGANTFKGIHAKAVITVPADKLKAYQSFLKKKGIGKSVTVKKAK